MYKFNYGIFSFKQNIKLVFLILIAMLLYKCSAGDISYRNSNRMKTYIQTDDKISAKAELSSGVLRPDYNLPSCPYDYHYMIMTHAIDLNKSSMLELFLQNGVNPDACADKESQSKLMEAAMDCKKEAFALLLKYGANPNHKYTSKGKVEKVELWIDVCDNEKIRDEMLDLLTKARKEFSTKSKSSSSDYSDTVILKSGQTITSVKTKIAGDSIIVDYPNGESKVFKKSQVKSVDKK